MVERLNANGVRDARVLDAMRAIPRHLFVDAGFAARSYQEDALPIGDRQTISKPFVVARMIELVASGRRLRKALELGTGCGYQAAAAPFDAIVIAAAGMKIPDALLDQLDIGGHLVAPVGGDTQVLTLIERTAAKQWRESRLDRVFFVPLESGVI